eukprot:1067782-Prorocentrum_lima.AAC.1
MTSSLVGSEMCIRDRLGFCLEKSLQLVPTTRKSQAGTLHSHWCRSQKLCLLYTSDAADDM